LDVCRHPEPGQQISIANGYKKNGNKLFMKDIAKKFIILAYSPIRGLNGAAVPAIFNF